MSRSRVSYVSRKKSAVSSSMTEMSMPSSLTMCTSTDDCFCHEHVRQRLEPKRSYAQRRQSSAVIASTSGSWSRLDTEHLLERVAAQPEAERLERDDFLRRDVPEVDARAEVADEPRLRRLRRRLPDEVVEVDLVRDLVDEAGAHVAVLAEDAGRPALARLGDHLPRAGVLLFLDPLDPLVRREHDLRVLRADLGEDGEVLREVLDQFELAVARDAEAMEPLLVLVQLVADEADLEERAADDDGLA